AQPGSDGARFERALDPLRRGSTALRRGGQDARDAPGIDGRRLQQPERHPAPLRSRDTRTRDRRSDVYEQRRPEETDDQARQPGRFLRQDPGDSRCAMTRRNDDPTYNAEPAELAEQP